MKIPSFFKVIPWGILTPYWFHIKVLHLLLKVKFLNHKFWLLWPCEEDI